MDQQKVQKAFIQFLVQKYKLKSQQELEAKIQSLGEKGLKAEYAEFQKAVSQQYSRNMMFGAKLDYIKGLKGKCPTGYEIRYYKNEQHIFFHNQLNYLNLINKQGQFENKMNYHDLVNMLRKYT